MTFIWIYHRIKYRKSGYGKFEYYVDAKTSWLICILLYLYEVIFIIAFILSIVYFGGSFIRSIKIID